MEGLRLSFDSLSKAVKFVPTNFIIHTDNNNYPCHLLLVASQSTTIASLVIDDNDLKEYTLSVPDPNDYFNLVIELINGEEIVVDSENAEFLNAVGLELKIPDLLHSSRIFLNDKGRNATIEFDPLHPFKGIISYFSPILDETELIITASSCSYYGHITNVVLQDLTPTYWESEDKSNSYLEFNFVNKRVALSAYSLRSANNDTDELHPKQWIVAGSNNQEEWFTLHQMDYTSDLCSASAEGIYECSEKESEESFQYIRIEMSGPNQKGNFVFRLARVEFYGQLSSIE